MITLYDFELDDGCYKVRLLLALLGLDVRKIAVDMLPGAEQKRPPLLLLNPLGTLPILTDGDLVLHEAEAIMTYLARRYDEAATWLPDAPAPFGQVMMWLSFAMGPLRSAAAARLQSLFDQPGGDAVLAAQDAFRVMDDHMTAREFAGRVWFVGDGPTLADIALFPSIALSRDCGIEHEAYPALRRWMRRVRALPGFITMPGIPDYH
jgi:glutathione S-transferase